MTTADPRGNLDQQFQPGERIHSRYEVIDILGEGGFAEVYACRDTTIKRTVAIKVLKPLEPLHTESDDEFKARRDNYEARFSREASCAAQINHPNVVTIHDFGMLADTAQPFMVMELLEGSTLRAELERQGCIAPDKVLGLFVECLEGLALAHDLGIVHKDLKPSNLIFSGGLLRIVDFGIARVEGDKRLTARSELSGTLSYLAPEYILEKTATPALDVFQMGLIMAEVLVGTPLLKVNSLMDCIDVYNAGDIKPPHPLLTTALGDVLTQALRHDPEARFPDARAFADALRDIDPAPVKSRLAAQGIVSNRTDPYLPELGRHHSLSPTDAGEADTLDAPDIELTPLPEPLAVKPLQPTEPMSSAEITAVAKDDPDAEPIVPSKAPITVQEKVDLPDKDAHEPATKPKRRVWLWALTAVVLISVAGVSFVVIGGMKMVEGLLSGELGFEDSDIVPVGDSPAKGAANSPVILVIFNDFTSDDGARLGPIIKQIMSDYPEDVRIVYKHKLVRQRDKKRKRFKNREKEAIRVARASVAAHQQGLFWPFHNRAFKHEGGFSQKEVEKLAKASGLDVGRFKKDLSSDFVKSRVDADLKLARKLGVKGVPTLYVNGFEVRGLGPLRNYKQIIDGELKAYEETYESYAERVEINHKIKE